MYSNKDELANVYSKLFLIKCDFIIPVLQGV